MCPHVSSPGMCIGFFQALVGHQWEHLSMKGSVPWFVQNFVHFLHRLLLEFFIYMKRNPKTKHQMAQPDSLSKSFASFLFLLWGLHTSVLNTGARYARWAARKSPHVLSVKSKAWVFILVFMNTEFYSICSGETNGNFTMAVSVPYNNPLLHMHCKKIV